MSIFSDKDPVPNKFTVEMGKLIQQAREDSGLSQGELADRIFRRRETLSIIENGRSEVGAITLARISAHTNKPLSYFFPEFAKTEITEGDLSSLEQQLLLEYRRIADDKKQEIAIKQVKILADSEE